MDNHGTDSADDLICDWLAARTDDGRGAKDSRKNANIWRGSVDDSDMFLFVASYLRIQLSNPLWQSDAMNRKGTLAIGKGWVHAEKHDLTPITG